METSIIALVPFINIQYIGVTMGWAKSRGPSSYRQKILNRFADLGL